MRRVFKYTNAIAAIVAIAALGLFYRYIWLGFPTYSGPLALDVSAEAEVVRDQHGIPHIRAKTIDDAIYLQGFTHAQDRFWQMEATRRLAAGEMAEIAGAALVPLDTEARQLRLRRTATRMAESLPESDRKLLAAYARGVNDWLRTNGDRLPLEIRLLGYTPRPWVIADTILLGLHMYRQLSTSWTTEADQAAMLAQGVPSRVQQLFPTRTGSEVMLGSNAFAVSGAHSATGKPLLAGDPHLMPSWPSTFYLNHLQAEDLDVIGGSLPGSPAVIIGHNQSIAWSMTTLQFDVQDLYFNEPRIIAREREIIRVKNGRNVELDLPLTPLGPIMERNSARYAMRWVPHDGAYQFPFLELNRARNWEQFRQALSRFPGPCHNFVYADVEGNIGYQAAGRFPLRQTRNSDLPLDATKPENLWQGFIPFADLPSSLNPPAGLIVNSNQNPFPVDYKYPVAGIFTPPYRQRQIHARLSALPKVTTADLGSIQMDVYSAFHHFLAQQLVAAAQGRKGLSPETQEAITLLSAWNGQMEIGIAAPMIVSLAEIELRNNLLRRASSAAVETVPMFASAVLEDVLRHRPKDWFDDYDLVLVHALVKALETGQKQQGSNPKFWDYGRYNKITVTNFVLGEVVNVGKLVVKPNWPLASWLRDFRIPLLDNYVQAGPAALSGTTLTVKQVGPRVSPAFRFVADTSDWDHSTFTIMLGQSGHAFAAHSKDYWPAYYSGQGISLPYKKIEANDALRIRPSTQNGK